jgi:hypothetical protein
MMYVDRRLGGVEQRYVGLPPDYGMRIPDLLRECVCFLYVEVQHKGQVVPSYGGTGFFVNVQEKEGTEGDQSRYLYLVTARHCVRDAEKYGGLWVRYTDHQLQTQTARLPRELEWTYPDDPCVDVAVTLFGMGMSMLRASLLERVLITDEKLAELYVGPGDDVALIGLFTQHSGKGRNLPIVRSGVIAAMPEEKIFDATTGQLFDAYLVEVRSIGGLSGSPVFVSLGYSRGPNGEINQEGRSFVIGVIRGHWDHKSPLASTDFAQRGEEELRTVNMGMATVTPTREVLALLHGDKLVSERKRLKDQAATRTVPVVHTEDSAFGPSPTRGPEPERLKIDATFEDSVKRAMKKGKPPKRKRG